MTIHNTCDNSFLKHLNEAIEINKGRKPIYSQLSQGKSRFLSFQLIFLEQIARIGAWYIDYKARKFQREGIPIIAKDFVPMDSLPSPYLLPVYRNGANSDLLKNVKNLIGQYKKAINHSLAKNDFAQVAADSHKILSRLKKLEKEHQCHFAMAIHIIESLGLASLNAPQYAAQSQGRTLSLSRTFIWLQSLALTTAVCLDKQAQKLHQKGIGILVNDVPAIPFEAEFIKANSSV